MNYYVNMDRYIGVKCILTLQVMCYYILNHLQVSGQSITVNTCYNYYGVPKKCSPRTEDLAYGRLPVVTSTCGSHGDGSYYVRTDTTTLLPSQCSIKTHHAKHMTDRNQSTFWQSENMYSASVQFPHSVNVTLDLGIESEISDIVIRFQSSRPESMAILKKVDGEGWSAYQYFSSSCESTYNLLSHIGPNYLMNVKGSLIATCLYQYSHLVPLSGGYVVFSTNTYDNTLPNINKWYRASSIRLLLNRINTFGEVTVDAKMLKSYYYAISEMIVFGKCQCHGHASHCESNGVGYRKCVCEHNTMGKNCEQCKPFFNNRPWKAASERSGNACEMCNCNGRATKCRYNATLYKSTLNGGICEDCENNTTGDNCEKCLPGYKFNANRTACVDVNECTEMEAVCGSNSCINTEGSYKCNSLCPLGFQIGGNGKCEDTDECLMDHMCENGRCANTPGSYNCICDSGYYLSAEANSCLPIITDHPEDGTVTFIEAPRNKSARLGQKATFRCVTDPPANMTFWYFNGIQISSSYNPFYGKVSLTDGVHWKEKQLHVTSIGAQNYGEYSCEAITEKNVGKASGWLNPPGRGKFCSISFLIKPSNVIVEYRSDVHLKCRPTGGKDKVTVKWYKEEIKEGRKVLRKIRKSKSDEKSLQILHNGYLFIPQAREKHSGSYVCEIHDRKGCSLRATAEVKVYSYINEICGMTTNNVTHFKDILQPPPEMFVERIKRGEEAPMGSAPWQVSVQHKEDGHLCGGSVINKNWVITAAHCFTSGKERLTLHNTWLKFGKHTLKSWGKKQGLCPFQESQEQVRQVEKRIFHPNYSIINKDNDITLLKVTEPIDFNDYIRPICLPNSGYGFKHARSPGRMGLVTGWGKSELSTRISNVLYEATVPIQDFDTCFQTKNTTMTKNMFCAGDVSPYFSDACKGDSGGPFSVPVHMTRGNNSLIQWHLAGVISWGPPCRGSPPPSGYGFYTNVTTVLQWIHQVINQHS